MNHRTRIDKEAASRAIRVLLTTILAALLIALLTGPLFGVTVRIRRKATVTDPSVTVGDVARIFNGDRAAQQKIAAIPLTVLDEASGRGTIRAEVIRRRIAEHGLNMATVLVKGFVEVEERLAGEAGSGAHVAGGPDPAPAGGLLVRRVRKAMVDHVARCSGVPAKDVVLELDPDAGLPDLSTDAPVRVTAPEAFRWGAHHVFKMTGITVEGEAVRFSVRCPVTIMEKRIVAVEPLRRGATITPESVHAVRQKVGQGYSGDFVSPEEIEGMTAARTISKGQTLRMMDVEPPVLVRRGDLVEARIDGGGFTLTRRLVARQEGARGDTVRLVDPDNRRQTYIGRVVGPRRVQIAKQ